MTFDSFLKLVHDAGVDTSPYLSFSVERLFVYPAAGRSKKPVKAPPFIIQYWETGGVSGGSCWDSSDPQSYSTGKSAPITFTDLVKILTATCPNLTFLQYETVKSVIKEGEEVEREWYGNHTDYSYQLIILRDLYDKLVEIGAITS